MTKPQDIQRLVTLVTTVALGYNETGKEEFRRLARATLKEIAKRLELPAGSYDIRWNPGGIAGSGDMTLHSETMYVDFSQSALGNDFGFMYRQVKCRKDYTGGCNHWMRWQQLENLDEAVAILKVTMEPYRDNGN